MALPVRAHAHGSFNGVPDVIAGIIHPLTAPLQILLLLGLAIWLGRRAPFQLKPMLAFVPCSAVGLLVTLTGRVPVVPPPILLALALAMGALVALAAWPPNGVILPLFGLAGLVLGLDSAVDHAASGFALAKTLLGTWIGLSMWLVTLAFNVSECPPRQWIQIGFRVVGSWIVAIALLCLAFALKK